MMARIEEHALDRRYGFRGGRGDWPTDRPAHTSTVTIDDAELDEDVTLQLTPHEARSLTREAVRALVYVHLPRRDGQWESTWQRDVEVETDSIVGVVDAMLQTVA